MCESELLLLPSFVLCSAGSLKSILRSRAVARVSRQTSRHLHLHHLNLDTLPANVSRHIALLHHHNHGVGVGNGVDAGLGGSGSATEKATDPTKGEFAHHTAMRGEANGC